MSGWQPTSILRKIPKDIPSSTSPHFVTTDAGNGFLKMPQNPQGPNALASEWIGTRLAEWFGLPVFDYSLISVSQADVDPESDDETIVSGFITREEDGNIWSGTERELRIIENPGDLSNVVVFDTWVGNFDRHCWVKKLGEDFEHRNDGNVFLSNDAARGKLKFKVYDHTHCQFSVLAANPQIELAEKIEDEAIYGLFPEFRTYLNSEQVTLAAARLSEIDDDTIAEIVDSLPTSWVESRKTRSMFADFIKRRSSFVSGCIHRKIFPQGELT